MAVIMYEIAMATPSIHILLIGEKNGGIIVANAYSTTP
jgi:hypothetical protein